VGGSAQQAAGVTVLFAERVDVFGEAESAVVEGLSSRTAANTRSGFGTECGLETGPKAGHPYDRQEEFFFSTFKAGTLLKTKAGYVHRLDCSQ
jgi:hypothetical protein